MEDIDEVWPDMFSKISSIRLVLRLARGMIKQDEEDEAAEEEQEADDQDSGKDGDTDDDEEDEADSSDYGEADTNSHGVAVEDEEEDSAEEATAENEGEQDAAPDSYQQLNRILHSLMALPMLKHLHIAVKTCPEHVSDELLASILHPVSQLAHNKSAHLTFEGVPKEVTTSLEVSRARMREKPSHRTLLAQLGVEVMPAHDFYNRVVAGQRANGIIRLLGNVITEADDCFNTLSVYFDSAHYDRCTAALTSLRSCLKSAAYRDLVATFHNDQAAAKMFP